MREDEEREIIDNGDARRNPGQRSYGPGVVGPPGKPRSMSYNDQPSATVRLQKLVAL